MKTFRIRQHRVWCISLFISLLGMSGLLITSTACSSDMEYMDDFREPERFLENPKFGVLIRTDSAIEACLDDLHPDNLPQNYIIEFNDRLSDQYTIVDSVDFTTYCHLVDVHTLARPAGSGTTWSLATSPLTNLSRIDTLLVSSPPADGSRWIDAIYYSINVEKKLIAYNGFDRAFPEDTTRELATVILNYSTDGRLDTLAILDNTIGPCISEDGSEIFMFAPKDYPFGAEGGPDTLAITDSTTAPCIPDYESEIFSFALDDDFLETYGGLDTLAISDSTMDPCISEDLKELLMFAPDYDPFEPGLCAVIYDVETGTLHEPTASKTISGRIYRPNKSCPLYFERDEHDRDSFPVDPFKVQEFGNIWKLDDELGEIKLTHFSRKFIRNWSIIGDSLICQIADSMFANAYERVSIELD